MGYEEKKNGYTTDQDLIEISGKHAYNLELSFRDVITVNGRYYTIKHTNFDTASGMQAMLLENVESKELIIAYQGTNMGELKDIATDISLAGNIAPQQLLDAKKYYNQMTAEFGKVSYVCGNSLGGGLANYVAVNVSDVKSVTYNPAILPDIAYDTKDYGNRIKNYLGKYDPLTLIQLHAGFMERVPGQHIFTHISIPGLAFFIANHVGYLDGDVGKVDMGEGKPPILIDVDDLLPFSIWTGKFLSEDFIGNGQKITIDVQSLTTLQNSFGKMVNMMTQAKTYTDAASQIVEVEGSQFSARLEYLRDHFDEVVKDTPLGWLTLASGYSMFNDIVCSLIAPNFDAYLEVVQFINSTPVLREFSSMVSKIPVLDLIKGGAELLPTLDIVIESLGDLKIYAIPMLFKGLDNFFDDGVVGQLSDHYVHIISNENILMKRVENFQEQVGVVRNNMEAVDMALASGTSTTTQVVPETIKEDVDHCKVLTHNMSLKNMQLDTNYQEFSNEFQNRMNSALSNLYQCVESLCNGLDSLITLGEIINKGLLGFLTKPIVVKGVNIINRPHAEQLLADFGNDINVKREVLASLSGLKSIVKAAKDELGNILIGIKPYIKNSIFNNSEYSKVIAYNLATMNIYDTLNIVYKDVFYQLSENEAESVQILEKSAEAIANSMEIVSEQIETGTIGI